MSNLVPRLGNRAPVPAPSTVREIQQAKTERRAAEIESVAKLTSLEDQAKAFLTHQALSNTAALVNQAEAHMQTAPAGARYYEQIIGAYAQGAARRIGSW
ncbi:hypothetical protein [Corynebacterium variabile]|uniref:hypothetical protein n=1 Tax=Corynebacterium variabile TaxID=1727 RepID=UPI003A927847